MNDSYAYAVRESLRGNVSTCKDWQRVAEGGSYLSCTSQASFTLCIEVSTACHGPMLALRTVTVMEAALQIRLIPSLPLMLAA